MANSVPDPIQEMTDAELVAAAKGGTETAFAELHRRYLEYDSMRSGRETRPPAQPDQ